MAKITITTPELTKKQKIVFVVVAIIIVAGIMTATIFFKAIPKAPTTLEELAADKLSGELNTMKDINTTELENLLKTMTK
jgi:uncharacterized protein YpmB